MAVHKKSGHAAYALRARFALFGKHFAPAGIAGKDLLEAPGIEAALYPDPPQHLGHSHILGIDEIRPEQVLDDRILPAVLASQPDQAVSVERVRYALDSIEAEADAFLRAGFHHV